MRAATLLAAALAALTPASAQQLSARHQAQARDTAPTTASGMLDMTAWGRKTSDLCAARLSMLDAASNPSGTAICYNIPMLNNQTGRFLAELRLYMISDPTDAFLGVAPQNLQLGLQYTGAMASRLGNDTLAQTVTSRRSLEPEVEPEAGPGLGRRDSNSNSNSNPQLLETHMFVGQIDTTRLTAAMTE